MTALGTLLVLVLGLAGILLTSGVLKLRDPRGNLATVRDFGVPQGAAAAVAIGVPLAEIAFGIGLLVLPGLAFAVIAWSTVVLMIAFTTGVSVRIARGDPPRGHFFGSLDPRPLGQRSVIVFVLLTVLALVVALVFGDPSWPGFFGVLVYISGDLLLQVVLITATGVFVTLLWNRVTRLTREVADLRAGVDGGSGESTGDDAGIAGGRSGSGRSGTVTDDPSRPAASADPSISSDPQVPSDPFDLFRPPSTAARQSSAASDPEAGSDDADTLRLPDLGDESRSGSAGAADRTRTEVLSTTGELHLANGFLTSGLASAPATVQETLTGTELPLVEVRRADGLRTSVRASVAGLGAGRRALIVWRTDCEYSRSILAEVSAASARGSAVVLTSSDPGEVRALGITGLVLVSPDREAMSAMNVPGTPVGFLVEGGGVLEGPFIGADAVRELLHRTSV